MDTHGSNYKASITQKISVAMGTCEWGNKYLLSDQSVVSRRSKGQGFLWSGYEILGT